MTIEQSYYYYYDSLSQCAEGFRALVLLCRRPGAKMKPAQSQKRRTEESARDGAGPFPAALLLTQEPCCSTKSNKPGSFLPFLFPGPSLLPPPFSFSCPLHPVPSPPFPLASSAPPSVPLAVVPPVEASPPGAVFRPSPPFLLPR